VRAVALEFGGWDTHSDEPLQLEAQAADLGGSLAAFHEDLGAHADRTLLLAMSEFGRTAAENGAVGTDHGRAGVMWALGGGIAGGRVLTRAGWPGLAPEQLTDGRDLAVTTDFRDVFAEVLDRHLGLANLAPALPGFAADADNYPGLFT
jgi:uncharacterized protein (DUF1501 family)